MRIAAIAGWLIALGAAAGAVILYMELESVKVELEHSREAARLAAAEATGLKQQMAQLEQDLAQREDTAVDASPAAGLDTASLLKGLMGNMGGGEEGAENENPFAAMFKAGEDGGAENPFLKMLSGEGEEGKDNPMGGMFKAMGKLMASEAGQEFMGDMVESQVLSQYDDLFAQLNLSPEMEEKVKGIYLANAQQGIGQAMGMFSGDVDMNQMMEDAKTQKDSLRTELAKVLSPAQMTQVDAYEEALPIKMMGDSYKWQLRMSAPALSADLIDSAATAIAEETHAATRDVTNFSQHQALQQEAMERALARMESQLDEEQYQQLQRFVEQQADGAAWAERMFGMNEEVDVVEEVNEGEMGEVAGQ